MKAAIISDTHNQAYKMKMPNADILICAGDFTLRGSANEIAEFNKWLHTVKDKYDKIFVIAGNHDFLFQNKPSLAVKLLTEGLKDKVEYLENRAVEYEG